MWAASMLSYGWVTTQLKQTEEERQANAAFRAVYKGACHEGSRNLKCVLEGGQLAP